MSRGGISGPSIVEFKGMRFLITDRPTPAIMPQFIKVFCDSYEKIIINHSLPRISILILECIATFFIVIAIKKSWCH